MTLLSLLVLGAIFEAEVDVLQQILLITFDESSQIWVLREYVGFLPFILILISLLRRFMLLIKQTCKIGYTGGLHVHTSEALINCVICWAIDVRAADHDGVAPPINIHPRQYFIAFKHHITANINIFF